MEKLSVKDAGAFIAKTPMTSLAYAILPLCYWAAPVRVVFSQRGHFDLGAKGLAQEDHFKVIDESYWSFFLDSFIAWAK